MDIRQRLLAAFELEHKDHLTAIRAALRDVEATGAPPDLVEIHRRAHSLKGAARAVDLPEVESLSHRLEAAFIAVQRGEAVLDAATMSVVRRALDAIEDVVAWSAQGGAEIELAGVTTDLERIAGERVAIAAPPPPPRRAVREPERAPERLPERPPGRPPERVPERGVPERAQERAGDLDSPTLVRIAAQGLERLSDTASALLPEIEAQAGLGEELRLMRQEWRALERSWRHLRAQLSQAAVLTGDQGDARGPGPAAAFEQRFRILGGALDRAHRSHDRLLWSMRRWGGGFQEDMRRLRMLPAENQLGGLGRMIRDISRSEGKEVEVDIRGMEVEADRAVLQRLKDPILHIARNAISHGIESPAERMALGKRPAARVLIAASVDGARLRLRIEDDGRGLNRAAIARRAVERDLLPPEEAADAPLERLVEFLFHPGFSTATRTTELAGRGMGLAIARSEVERLQGNLAIAERPGGGTAVTIEVPLSLLSQRLVFVGVQDQILALPSADVVRLRRTLSDTLFAGVGTPMIRLEEEDVPVTSLAALLGLEAPVLPSAAKRLSLLVVRSADRRLALAVDRFVTTREAVVTAAEETGLDPARYLGTVLLDDGGPCLVLNVPGLMPLPGSALPAAARPPEEAAPARAHILVVDDSITTRTLEKSILEAHGYRVTLCVDGREALDRLSGGMEVGLIISDVEMPRMDGFALLQAVKADKRLAETPVILVTSRSSDEDRERGLRLGADAYIVKTRFDQNELLAGIRRLL
ncbi:hybrid sensor histidine kinase/response regulator [Azospirillum doebereinerae]|uniref:Chemotaxis protein CheA n=1 Tax=Azospirillum doebereinerae TaxID=92933 RepID=A0A3S0VFG2_9PROT|nr:response regulator [Azospirillum doebereinerae]RUQ66204.1 hybrid sensor histidine kinase/response regulator [Azospirillum doebereinerae]